MHVNSHGFERTSPALAVAHVMLATTAVQQGAAVGTQFPLTWSRKGLQRRTDCNGAEGGFLMLDHNFNQSVDNATELLSNPLVADPAQGLRSLAAFDANADGKIDASDPVYAQLKVWQDLNQDSSNTAQVAEDTLVQTVQDETGGAKEFRSLAGWGSIAIDYNNSRYEYSSASGTTAVGYSSISTQALEAQEEGTLYTPVGASIRIDATNQQPEVVIMQGGAINHYQKHSCLRIFYRDKGAFVLSKTPGNAANQTQWR